MPGGPSHREHTPPPMHSQARRIGQRRGQHPQPILPHICMISVIMAALVLSLPFCDSESSPTGHAMASTIAERLEGERAIAYAALGGASADLRSRSPWRPWQRRVEGAAAGAGVASSRSSNCACSSCRQAQLRHAQGPITGGEASRHPVDGRVRQARRVAAFVSPGGRPLAGGHQELRDGSLFSHRVSSAFNSAAALPRPAAAQQPHTAPQRPQQCSASTATRCHPEACGGPRSKPGRSRSQLQAGCCCSGDGGDGLSDAPSPSVVTFGNNVHSRRRYSWAELPRVTETNSFSSTKEVSQRASHRASQWTSQRASRDATALWASAGDSSSSAGSGGESGVSPPQAEQQQQQQPQAGGRLASVRAPLLVTIGPQCAGKTTLLRALSSGRPAGEGGGGGDSVERSAVSVRDVAIDDHPAVREGVGREWGRRFGRSKAVHKECRESIFVIRYNMIRTTAVIVYPRSLP